MAIDTPAFQTCLQSVTWLWQFWGDPHTEMKCRLLGELQCGLRGVDQPTWPDTHEQRKEGRSSNNKTSREWHLDGLTLIVTRLFIAQPHADHDAQVQQGGDN